MSQATTAWAGGGGGGSKGGGKIVVDNDSDFDALVIIDNQALIDALTDADPNNDPTPAQFLAAGKIVEAGEDGVWTNVKAGGHLVTAIFLEDNGQAFPLDTGVSANFNVNKNAKTNIRLTNDGDFAVFTPAGTP